MSRSIPVVVLLACAGVAVAALAPPVPVPSDEGERLLARGKKFAERGQIDLFVACTAAWKLKADDPQMWEPSTDLGRRLIEKAEMKKDHRPQDTPSSYKSFAAFVDGAKPQFTRRDEAYFRPNPDNVVTAPYEEVIQAPGVVSPVGIAHCLILSQCGVQAGHGIQHSVVFANGDVTARTNMNSVVIVCDGDVTSTEGQISRAVIVARGNITAKAASGSVVMAGGKVDAGNKDAILKGQNASTIVENKPNTLGITFFELAQVGLKVKAADGSVTVEAVEAKSASEKAGLKVGDVILEANGKKPTDAEALRRLLRDSLALGDAPLKVKRGNETPTLKVALPE